MAHLRKDAVTSLVSHFKALAVTHAGFAMTERDEFQRQALQCRRLARATTDAAMLESLTRLADELEAKIAELDARAARQGDPKDPA